MGGFFIPDDVKIRGDGVAVFFHDIDDLFDGVVEILAVCRGGCAKVIHRNRIRKLIVCKELAVAVIDIASCGCDGDFSSDSQLEIGKVGLTIYNLQQEQTIQKAAGCADGHEGHDQGSEIDFLKKISPEKGLDILNNTNQIIKHLFVTIYSPSERFVVFPS